jgi:hypothetical protein
MFRQDEIIIIQPQRRGFSQHPGAVARSRRWRNRPGPTRPAARPEATTKRGILLSPACSQQLYRAGSSCKTKDWKRCGAVWRRGKQGEYEK